MLSQKVEGPDRMGRVAGKVALVTGAASGIGEASSILLIAEGAKVVLCDIDVEKGEALARRFGDDALFVRLDVGDEQQWIAAIETTLSHFGSLDILVNNAGVVVVADVEQTTEKDWRFVHSVGTDGTFFGSKHGIRAMRKSGGGSIINMSSVSAIGGYPYVFAYSASKGAIRAMTKSAAVHCAQRRYGIRCNSIHPSGIATPMILGRRDELEDAVRASDKDMPSELTGLGMPEDVANMVLYLASDESKFVNGAEFVIDNAATVIEGKIPG
jgi:3(or 17)beta-hydroxysteroid dehydrogenase